MAEPTLTLTVEDLKAEIGHYLGYGRGPVFSEPAWTTIQTNVITACLKSGLSWVYVPPPVRLGEPSHNWSFLRPFENLTLVSGITTVPLPDHFGGFEGPIYINNPTTPNRVWELRVTNQGQVEQALATYPTRTGPPLLACEALIANFNQQSGSTRSNLLVYPIPDANYNLRIQYKHSQDALVSGVLIYPPGGADHGELFKASCIAAAELQLDDERGPRWADYLVKLEASILADRKRKGQRLGYNGDRSDARNFYPRDARWGYWGAANPITYNGQPF